MAHPFDGIGEKLKRSNENIHNLETEIAYFFESSKYPVLSQDNKKVFLEAIEYHQQRVIPVRFSVLAGEVIPRSHRLAILHIRLQEETFPEDRISRSQYTASRQKSSVLV
jgi:hypothetical protein